MPVNLAAAALFATGVWAISTYTIFAHDGSAPRELWTVTSSDKNPKHPTLARASVPRSLTSARATYVARQEVAQLSAR
jgi:hypothetical protein